MLQKDIFILQQRDDILYGLYAKLSQDRLAKALPTSYRHGGGDYLVCIFCDSMDFVGQLTEEILHKDITTIITYRSMDVGYSEIQKIIPTCNQKIFDTNKQFLLEQLSLV